MSAAPDTLILRADAGSRIGTGHVMRCLALASAWRASGGRTLLLSANLGPRLQRRASEHSDALVDVKAAWPDPADLECVLTAATTTGARCVVVDGYHFDASYHGALRDAGLCVVCIDDHNHLTEYAVDVLLNQNVYAHELDYRLGKESVALLGCDYALLRPEFWDPAREPCADARPSELSLLVTLGGADPVAATESVLAGIAESAALASGRLRVEVVVGAENPRREAVARRVRALGRAAALHFDAADMARLLARADLAISAAGTTCWELLRMGVPAALVVLAENQRRIAEALERRGLFVSLGDHAELEAGRVAAVLDELVGDAPRRRAMSRRGRQLVDGGGALRAARAIRSRLAEGRGS